MINNMGIYILWGFPFIFRHTAKEIIMKESSQVTLKRLPTSSSTTTGSTGLNGSTSIRSKSFNSLWRNVTSYVAKGQLNSDEFMRSSFLPKCKLKITRISALPNKQGTQPKKTAYTHQKITKKSAMILICMVGQNFLVCIQGETMTS